SVREGFCAVGPDEVKAKVVGVVLEHRAAACRIHHDWAVGVFEGGDIRFCQGFRAGEIAAMGIQGATTRLLLRITHGEACPPNHSYSRSIYFGKRSGHHATSEKSDW